MNDTRVPFNRKNPNNRDLQLEELEGHHERITFDIEDEILRDEESITYLAKSGNKIGYLREFYPSSAIQKANGYLLIRNIDNYVQCDKEDKTNVRPEFSFETDNERFTDFLKKIQNLRPKDSKEDSFFPDSTLLTSTNYKSYNPVYSWTESEQNKQFLNQYIENFKISATANEKKLRPVLKVIKSLIDLELAFLDKFETGEEVSYLDLDKNNFLVTRNKTLVEVSDLEVINPVLLEGKNAKKDLFSSLGNLLLECLQSEPYEPKTKTLRMYIDQSEIIENSDLKYEYIIKEKLTDFLEIAFINKKKKDLKDMADILDSIITILSKRGYFKGLKVKRNEVKDINSKTYIQHRKNVIDALVTNSLSDVVNLTGNDPINVLILGFGLNGQAALDDILPIWQLRNHPLNVTILDKRMDELYENYFGARAGLLDYLEIEKITNGEVKKNIPEKALSGIHLRFENPDDYGCDFSNKAKDYHEGLKNILTPEDGKEFNYIFISLGDNQTTKEVSKDTKSLVNNLYKNKDDHTAITHFLTGTSDKNSGKISKHSYFYYMGNDMEIWKNFAFHPEFRRLAFNVFYLWKNSSNPNLEQLEKTFKDDYYETAAYVSALGLLLNLNTLSASDFPENAKAKTTLKQVKHLDSFKKATLNRMSGFLYESLKNGTFPEELIEELAYWDHRNWMLSRLCFGWKHPNNWDNPSLVDYMSPDFYSNNGRDEENRYLVSLVDSSPTDHLKSKSKDFWLEATDEDLKELDDLERASVKIFQESYNKHKKIFENANLYNLEYQILQKRIEYITRAASSSDEGEALIDLFNRFMYCVTNIQNGSRSYLKSFDLYLNAFKDKLKQINEKTYEEVLPIINNIEETTRLTKKSVQMTNFKDTNRRVIKNLPFVLSYSHDFELASWLDFKDNPITSDEIFKNVSAASVLLPKKITYYYQWKKDISQEEFLKKFTTILDYFNERNIDSQINLILNAAKADLDWLKDKLTVLKNERKHFNFQIYSNHADFKTKLIKDAESKNEKSEKMVFDLSRPYFKNPIDQNLFINSILPNEMSWFLFDSRTLQFKTSQDFEFLKYTYLDNLYIRAKELFTLSNKRKNKLRAIELYDELEPLWDLYTGSYLGKEAKNEEDAIRKGLRTWNTFCSLVDNYYDSDIYRNAHVFFIDLSKNDRAKPDNYVFYLPYACYNSVNFLLNLFKDERLISEDSHIKSGLSDSFKLVLHPKNVSKSGFQRITDIFKKPELLTDPRNIFHYKINNSLRVELRTNSDVELNLHSGIKGDLKYHLKLLGKQLKRRGYLTRYEQIDREDKIKFSFTSNRYRNLLSQGGAMLEVFTFYKLLNSPFFDDIISGYTVLEEKTNQEENEIDLILTKDFHTYFLECKGTNALERIYYPKIKALADHYGVNEQAVLIFLSSNLKDSEEKLKSLIEYGEENRVKTIQLNEDFTNLENRLEEIYSKDRSKDDYWK